MTSIRKIYIILACLLVLVASILIVRNSLIPAMAEGSSSLAASAHSSRGQLEKNLSDNGKDRVTSSATTVEEESLSAIEMKKVVAIPATIGKQGLWAGESPSDSAIGGRTAYAFARAGESREDLKPDQNGLFQRLHAPKNQRIEFQVRYPGLKAGASVDVGILDGGTLEEPQTLTPDSQGRVSFVFHTGPTDGSYRISLSTSDGDTKMLDVWAGRPEWEDPVSSN
jgi:hypothetical protein